MHSNNIEGFSPTVLTMVLDTSTHVPVVVIWNYTDKLYSNMSDVYELK